MTPKVRRSRYPNRQSLEACAYTATPLPTLACLQENTVGSFVVKDKIDVAKRVNKIEQGRVFDKRIRISEKNVPEHAIAYADPHFKVTSAAHHGANFG